MFKTELNQIKPKEKNKSDKYSWQLYNYFKKNKFDINKVRVIFDTASWFDGSQIVFNKDKLDTTQVWIGIHSSDNWLYGNKLSSIIGSTNKKYQKWANPWLKQNETVDITEWFWSEYIKIGRCIWDKSHDGWLMNDDERFTYIDEDNRVCNWCGEKQHKKIRRKINVKREVTWECQN